jgi:hypothetical protein
MVIPAKTLPCDAAHIGILLDSVTETYGHFRRQVGLLS